ncbi:hypothetical protein KP79_PYT00839 [Mizuhopecten yessoensis]|uniref:Uncharacterized protein n=1 Tax=Mizuhopecten yessoensis TaxID=6573 RepID=A0A210QPR1_MIZYE|nr:hypothetical protein KP79_PYT00839 [Mizuhopecten yessoensis]
MAETKCCFWEIQEKWESEHSDSSESEDGENSDSDGSENEDKDEESDVVSQQTTTSAAALTNNISTTQTEIMDDCDDIDVSSRGRIRKRRVIPNNSEDPGTPKKRKLVNVSLPTTVPHVPNILQRPGKTLPSIGPVDDSSASQILLQTSSGNHTLLTGLPSNVKLVSGDKMFPPQALSLLQRPAQLQQHSQSMSHARLLQGLSQHTLSSKQASHPVIQQLLSTSRHPSPRGGLSVSSHPGALSSTPQRTVLFQPGNKQTNIRPAITKLTTPGLSMVGGAVDPQLPSMASAGGKIQYYAANINTLPPSVLQQLIKSNALKIPPGPNQSGMVLLTTVNPQGPTSSSQSQTIAGLQIQTAQNTPVRTVSEQTPGGLPQSSVPKTMIRLPVSTQVSSAAPATPGSSVVKKRIPQINNALVNIHMNVPSTNSSIGQLHHAITASTGGIVMSTSQIESTFALKEVSNANIEGSVGSVGVVSGVAMPTVGKPQVTSNSSSLSPTNISSTSPNRQPYKYANNVTVKTLLEARKDAEKIPGESPKPILVKKTSEITSSTPTVLLHPTSTGIKTLKIPSKAALDSAVQAVVTDVPTSLPTVNIKVPAPSAMPAIQPRYNVTKTIQSMKSPIPTAPRLDPMALSGHTSVNVTSPPSQTNQSLLTQLQAGNNQIRLTTLNKSSELGNMVLAAAQQPQDQKNMTVKVLPHSVQQSQQGVMQGYLTPQGLIIPQAALQQQANTQLLNQGALNNQTITQSILKTQTLAPGTVNKQTITPGIITSQNLTSGALNLQTLSQGAVGSLSSMPVQLGFKAGSVTSLVSGNQLISVSQSNSTIKQNMRKTLQNCGKVVQPASFVQSNYGSSPSNLIQSIAGTQEKTLFAAGVHSQAGNLITGLVRSGGSDAIGTKSVSSIINTTPVLSTSVISSASVKPSVCNDKSSSSVVDTQKGRLQAVGGGASTLLDLGGITKLQAQGQGLLMPGLIQGMNFVNVGGQLKLQEGGNNVTILGNNSINLSNMVSSTVSTCVSNPSLVSSNNTLGHIYPIVTLAGSTGSSGGQASQMVPSSPGPVPQAPLQLTSPLLGQLASPMGNFATVLGQIANPLNKTGVIGQTTMAGNLQLLGQPGVKVAGSSGQILRLPNQQMNIPSTSPSVIGQQLCLSGSSSQIIGQQLTSPIANQAPVVLGNIGQGSSSDLIKQLAAAQLQLSGQSSSALVNQIPNHMVLQVPASPGVKGQAMIRPPGKQNLQGGQTMLLLSPQKRLQGTSIGTGTQQPKQLTLRLNSPVLQQTQIKVPLVSSAKVTQDQNATQLSKVKLNFDLQAANGKPVQANVSKTQLQTPVMGSVAPVSTSQATEKPVLPTNPLHQKLGVVKTNTTTIGTVQQANVVRFNTAASQVRLQTPSQQSVVMSLPDTIVSPNTGPLLSPAKATTSQVGGSQKLFLYNIGGQLVTPQGVPVTVDNGVLKVLLPQAKTVSPPLSLGQKGPINPPVTIVSGANMVRYVVPTKPVFGSQSSSATESLTASVARSNDVAIVTSSPGSILTNQSTKVNPSVGRVLPSVSAITMSPSVGRVLPSVSAINMSPSVGGVSTRSTKGVVSPTFVTASVASHHSITNTPQSVRTATVNVTSSVLSQQLGSTSRTLTGNELHHIISPALTTGKTIPATDNVGLVNRNQITASSNLKISQLLGQQQSNVQDITVRLTGHSSVASTAGVAPNNKMADTTNHKTFHVQTDNRTQIGYQVSPNISSLIGSGQGYIVMPGTSKKTQIIFPQQGQQNSPSNTDNMKVLKTQNIAELLKSPQIPQAAFVQQGAVSVSLPVQAEIPLQNNPQVEPKSEVLNNNVALYRSQNVVDLGTNVRQTKVVTMDNNHKPDTVTNGVEDNQNLSNQVPPKPNQDNTSTETSQTTETPKGAEKEEAALNLLSLANLAFNR